MSIWKELLFLHGYLTHLPGAAGAAPRSPGRETEESAERLRAIVGCRLPPSEPSWPIRGPSLGIRGLA